MEKRFLLVGLVLLTIPACHQEVKRRRCAIRPVCKDQTVYCEEPVQQVYAQESFGQPLGESQPVSQTPMSEQPPVAEDIEGFVLEEPGNTFKLLDEEGEASLIEPQDEGEAWFDERAEQAQKHGFKTIYFKFGDYTISSDQQAVLDHNLKKISDAAKKGSTIVIEGHACRFAGSSLYNMHLSEQRASSVAHYLIEHGVPRERLKIVGRGNEMCLVPEGDKEQQAPNRRVEFYILKEDTSAPHEAH